MYVFGYLVRTVLTCSDWFCKWTTLIVQLKRWTLLPGWASGSLGCCSCRSSVWRTFPCCCTCCRTLLCRKKSESASRLFLSFLLVLCVTVLCVFQVFCVHLLLCVKSDRDSALKSQFVKSICKVNSSCQSVKSICKNKLQNPSVEFICKVNLSA